jgi:DNA mismatch repair protein MutS
MHRRFANIGRMTVSPMMQQYHSAKSAAGDALLLFRMGDFYELFYDDAKTAAKALGLTLTSRDKGENPVAMAGFPYHQLEGYLAKLISQGFRVAICEQVEDPKEAKGIVKREVTRVVTPGTLTDDGLLDPRENNYLAAVAMEPSKNGDTRFARAGLAWVELSTGRFHARTCLCERLADEIARISPAECLVADNGPPPGEVLQTRVMLTKRPTWAFAADAARQSLAKHFGTRTLEGFGFGDDDSLAVRAAGAVIDYLVETQKSSLDHIDRLLPYHAGGQLEIDQATRRSLEITRTMRDGGRDGALLGVIDRTSTAMGARLLAEWLANPLTDIAAINGRLDAVEEFVSDAPLAGNLREKLRDVYDLQRLFARVTTGRATPRDLRSVAFTLASLPSIKAKLTARKSKLLCELESQIDLCPELRAMLERGLNDDCPLTSRDGGFVRTGYNKQLDELRELASGGREWIARYQAQQIAESNIPSMKVGYNKVFGYYIEITNAHREKIPAHFIRKQTLKNAERYITPELKEYEEKVVSADDNGKELEYQIFCELRDAAASHARALLATAAALAQLDVLAALAELARQRGYCRPTLVDDAKLEIVEGRHPVLDVRMPAGEFVPNDCYADSENGHILLITGPNMAGKSTYIRQVALITLMSQIGSFVPAKRATIGIADRIFARVGASDELSRGQSTFMVEMTETARILNTATRQSLVILDEIGRGTSTYDGVSLAWAVVEHIHDEIGCRTLFATHYHELTDLADSLDGVANFNVAVREWEESVVFLHKIIPGAADKSYGIHVARLAGVPRGVNERAKQILAQLEGEHLGDDNRAKIARREDRRRRGDLQLTLFGPAEHPLLDEIRAVDANHLTPLEALRLVSQWQESLREKPERKPR